MLRPSCIFLLSLLAVALTSVISTPAPSVAPAGASGCSDAKDAVSSCLQANLVACSSCIQIALSLGSTTTVPESCQAAHTMTCPLYTCCPDCANEVEGAFECLTGSTSSLTDCAFNCGGSNTTTTTSSTPAPSVAPVASTPTASTPTTISPTASTPTASTPTASTPTASTPTASTPTASTPSAALSDCSDAEDAVSSCLQANLVACASCIEIALSLGSTTTVPESCQAAHTMTCPLYTCCPDCANEVEGAFECLAGSTSSLTDCAFNCGGSNTTNTTSSAPAPSVAPAVPTPTASTPTASTPTASTPSAEPAITLSSCSNATSAVKRCLELNVFFCAICLPLALNLSQTTTAPSDCQGVNSLGCPLYSCCPRCSSEIEATVDCLIEGASLFTNCTFNCGGSDSTGTNSTTSAAVPTSSKSWGLSLVIASVAAIFTSVIH